MANQVLFNEDTYTRCLAEVPKVRPTHVPARADLRTALVIFGSPSCASHLSQLKQTDSDVCPWRMEVLAQPLLTVQRGTASMLSPTVSVLFCIRKP